MKRSFGALLTLLGIIGIIWGAYSFMTGGGAGVPGGRFNALIPFVVGLIFFGSGIGLVKGTKDEA